MNPWTLLFAGVMFSLSFWIITLGVVTYQNVKATNHELLTRER